MHRNRRTVTELDRARARHARGAVGRWPFFARGGPRSSAAPEHVHADRAGCWRGLRLQRRGDTGARALSALVSNGRGRRVYFEPAAAIVVLVLLGQVLELRARSRTSAAIRTCSGSRRKPRGASTRTEPRRTCRSPMCSVGDRLRVRPGERILSTAACSRARRASTNRWSPASRSPWRSAGRPGDRRHRQWHGHDRDGGAARRLRHAARADRPLVARRSDRARRSSASPTPCRGGSCRAWSIAAIVTFIAWAIVGPSRGWRMRWSMPSRCSSSRARARSGSRRRCRSWWAPAAAQKPACCSGTPKRSKLLEQITTLVVDKTGTLTEGKPRLVTVAPQPRLSTRPHCCVSPRVSKASASIRSPKRSSRARMSGIHVARSAVRVDDR